MGRYIESRVDGEWKVVWKYALGNQPSEMFRIHKELGLGKYSPVHIRYERDENDNIRKDQNGSIIRYYEFLPSRAGAEYDILILSQEDIRELGEWLEILEADCKKEELYIQMIKGIYEFAVSYPSEKEIVLQGEF